jgi:hypothetical protein
MESWGKWERNQERIRVSAWKGRLDLANPSKTSRSFGGGSYSCFDHAKETMHNFMRKTGKRENIGTEKEGSER